MDAEKIEVYCRLWEQAKIFCRALSELAEEPENKQALDAASRSFPELQPHLSDTLRDHILYLFSGAEIEAGDLRKAGGRLLNELSGTVCKSVAQLADGRAYLGRSEAEKVFALWDKIPHVNKSVYQGIFECCMKASASAPMQAFQHTLQIFEEQPQLLSGKETPHPGYVYRASEQQTFDRCPICGGNGKPYYSAFSYEMADFSYPHLPVKLWMACGSCGNLYTWKYPKDLLRYSDNEEMIKPDLTKKLTATAGASGMSLPIWSNVLNKLSVYSKGKELLEVGIGQGELLAVALEMGYQPDAVEIVPAEARKVADMLGISIWRGDFLNYAPKKIYSVIIMGDVIEHVTDPEKALRNAYDLLEEDGVLWLSTPNFESSFSRMMKFHDPMWLEPYHISYFNRAGLEALASKCGFILREYSVSQRYNGSMELILTKRQR